MQYTSFFFPGMGEMTFRSSASGRICSMFRWYMGSTISFPLLIPSSNAHFVFSSCIVVSYTTRPTPHFMGPRLRFGGPVRPLARMRRC